MKKNRKAKKAGIIAGSVVALGIVAGGVGIGIGSANKKISVTFKIDKDNAWETVGSSSIKKGSGVELLEPMRKGYKFMGWYLDAEGTPSNKVEDSTKYKEDTILYAKWEKSIYEIKLEDNRGSSSSVSGAYLDRALIGNKSNLRDYTFLGWSEREGGSIIAGSNESNFRYEVPLYGTTLYAIWEGREINVRINGEAKTYRLGEEITLGQGTNEKFSGWTIKGQNEKLYLPGERIELTSEMVSNNEIEINENQGTEANIEVEYRWGKKSYDKSQLEDNKIKEAGYEFKGWYLEEDYKTEVKDIDAISTENGLVVLWAKLEGKEVEVKVNYGGATAYTEGVGGEPVRAKVGERISLPSEVREYGKYNLDFVGWRYKGEIQGQINDTWTVPVVEESEIEIEAVWGSAFNLINFNYNGGVGPEIKVEYRETGVRVELPSGEGINKLGYTFKGWSEATSGSVVYKAGEKYELNRRTTLYAIWEAKEYEIKYNLNFSGAGSIASGSGIYGSSIEVATVGEDTREGYIFEGWEISEVGGVVGTSGRLEISKEVIGSSSSSEIELRAIWTPKRYNFVIGKGLGETVNGDAIEIRYRTDKGEIEEYQYGEYIPYGSEIRIRSEVGKKKTYYELIGISKNTNYNGEDGAYGEAGERANFERGELTVKISENKENLSTISYVLNYKPKEVKIIYKDGDEEYEVESTYYGVGEANGKETKRYEETGLREPEREAFSHWAIGSREYDGDGIKEIGNNVLYGTEIIRNLSPENEDELRIEIEAKYQARAYGKVKFNNGDGLAEGGREEIEIDITIKESERKEFRVDISKGSEPTLAGYTFNGWKENASVVSEITFINDGSNRSQIKTVTADWVANSYAINFFSDNAKIEGTNETITVGTRKSLTFNNVDIEKAGHVLLGWTTRATATEKEDMLNTYQTI